MTVQTTLTNIGFGVGLSTLFKLNSSVKFLLRSFSSKHPPIGGSNCLEMEYKFLPRPEGSGAFTPAEARALFRRNGYYGNTSGFCHGYTQANLLVLPESLAEDFEEFCRRNSGPAPLLYKSKAGECSAPVLARDSDVKCVITLNKQTHDNHGNHGIACFHMRMYNYVYT